MTWQPTREEYYADPAIGSSALRDFLRSPLYFHDRYISETIPERVTDAMDKGSLADLMLTEPEYVDQLYVVTDLPRKGTKAWAAEEKEHPGKTLVKRDLWDAASAIAQAATENDLAMALLDGKLSGIQLAHKWQEGPLTCRMRLDAAAYTAIGPAMVDLKVWSWADPDSISRAIYNQGAHIQFGLYERGFLDLYGEDPLWVLVVVHSEAPYEVGIYQLTEDFAFLGRRAANRGLEGLAKLKTEDGWKKRPAWLPGYSQTITPIAPPRWVKEE